jgi:hypothetical protein
MPELEDPARRSPAILRGVVESVSLYEVTADELEILGKGSPDSTHLNFSIGLLSIGLSFLVAVLTTSIGSGALFTAFTLIAIVGFVLGVYFFVLWWRSRRPISDVVNRIKKRLPPRPAATVLEYAPFVRLIHNLEESHGFLSVKWLREKYFAGSPANQEALQIALDRSMLLTERIRNPKNPRYMTLTCRLNRDHPVVKEVLNE